LSRSTPSSTDGATAGFTLIEVLIAIAVVAISLVAIGSVMATTTRGVRSLEQHVSLMESARTIATNLPPRAQLAPGRLVGDMYGNRWQIDVSQYVGAGIPVVPNSQWIPQAIRVRLQSPSGAFLSLETIRLQRRRAE
jgi:general secretion pathway protein I